MFVRLQILQPRDSDRLSAAGARRLKLDVFDVSGRLIESPLHGWRNAGSHEITFDGSGLASGLYFYRLTAGDFSATGKTMLLK